MKISIVRETMIRVIKESQAMMTVELMTSRCTNARIAARITLTINGKKLTAYSWLSCSNCIAVFLSRLFITYDLGPKLWK